MQSPAVFIARRLCLIAAVASTAVILSLGVWISLSRLPYYRGIEMNAIFTIQKTMAGLPVYTDPADIPFEIAQYSPLYYLLCAGFATAIDLPPEDGAGITTLARLMSTVFGILLLGVMDRLMTRQLGVSRAYSVVACSFVFVSTCPYLSLAKPNALASLLMLCAYYVMIKGLRGSRPLSYASVIAATCLTVIAVCAKQNSILSIAIVLLFLVVNRDWWHFAVATVTLVVTLAIIAPLALEFLGPAIKENVMDGVDNGTSLTRPLETSYREFFSSFSFPVALVCVALVTWVRSKANPVERFLAIWLCATFLFASATILKVGSGMNYYNDFLVAAAVSIAYFFSPGQSSSREFDGSTLANITALYLLWFLPWTTLFHLYDYGYSRTELGAILQPKAMYQFASYEPVASYLRRKCAESPDSFVVSHELAINNLLPRRCLVPQKELARQAHDRGLVDYGRLQALVEAGRVRFVVLRKTERQHPKPFLGIRFDKFERVEEFPQHVVYEFRE